MAKILIRDPAVDQRDGLHLITDYSGAYQDSLNGNIKGVFFTNIPTSIPTPANRQPDDWSCGPYAMSEALNQSSGEAARNWLLARGLISSDYGTEYSGIVAYINSCGYTCTYDGAFYNGQMHPAIYDKILSHIKNGYKIILLMGGLKSSVGGPCRNSYWSNAGHYVCAYGTDETSTSSTTKTTTNSIYTFNPKQIKMGTSQSNEVLLLQEILKAKGYYKGSLDKAFGSATYAALIEFQKNNKITVDGICGPTTWKTLLKI